MLKGKKRESLTYKQKCDRCGNEDDCFTMSMFNDDWICMNCQDIEAHHPLYNEARQAELEACKSGNYNFVGIGLPNDLRR